MIRYLSKLKGEHLKNKVVLLRLDFNTEDDWRMRASLPTIRFLLAHCKALLVLSHKGRPKGFEKNLSLKGDAKRLGRLLRREVRFWSNFDLLKLKEALSHSAKKDVFVLENLRFLPGEEKNDAALARQLAALGDVYVNDAFAVSHRANASVVAITKFLPSYAGLELEVEIKALTHVLQKAQKPLVMIFGGAKIGGKLPILKKFKDKADVFLLGGALANTLLKLRGDEIGSSRIDRSALKGARPILKYEGLVLPEDYRTAQGAILDIGPETANIYAEHISHAKTIVWNGPMGVMEDPRFREGTRAVAKAIAANTHAYSVVGGGETVMALKQMRLDNKMSFVSTGGGAMLEYLSGKKLPGIEALRRKN